ncbi:hypothetical protein HPC49_28805 [Pyxidicoccus fallax]|uniref:Uncharacterized protein n=1 Tax=Pyxidicoccus fallax TaxID=394095 RepID=A0A848L6B0_9BACT|nr:hypothetical protein [Pyxidicoccus fallax]NMO14204.1 hypothetical protein [Pyxidicoccus fallax]NPC82205.1 hypothetical protein [Pyxidicoccus fallax]
MATTRLEVMGRKATLRPGAGSHFWQLVWVAGCVEAQSRSVAVGGLLILAARLTTPRTPITVS